MDTWRYDITEAWPVPDGSYDCVISNLVLEQVLRSAGTYFQSELHPFRQLQGSQAQFVRTDRQQPELVAAYQHDVSAYVGAGLGAGLVLKELEEWRDPEADALTLPRLLTLTWHGPT